jgi:oligoendopeptidase F
MTQPSSAQGVYWDLNDLYHGLDDPRIEADLKSCLASSQSFATQYRGFFKKSPTPEAIVAAFQTLEGIYQSLAKLGAYAGLRTAVDNLNVGCRQLEDRIDQASVEIQNVLTFFELEWLQVSEADAQKFADAPVLQNYQHYLVSSRRYKPHTLSEQEEVLLNHKSLTARGAWVNLFDEFLASMERKSVFTPSWRDTNWS